MSVIDIKIYQEIGIQFQWIKSNRISEREQSYLNLQTPAGKLLCTREMIITPYATPVELGRICKFMEVHLSE